ncbi:integrin alpha [Nitrosococcus watsonii]|uniref:FG-GAP repeat protein n=1 Tax=Nitrosococcus watsoni (strain C-113) TaxID=105559 RepID=D8K4W1_NITWC|nr:integrin alpha [Nitrosococcus watsonii]ADJ27938.1 FG-GAP repeat protein [Nitrosococcus watsonii C-113]
MNDNKATFTSRPVSSRSDSQISTHPPRALAPRPLAVALRRVLGGGLLAAGLMNPALGQSLSLELSDLDGSNGFALNGIGPGDSLGDSVSGAGDMNGDGFDDLVIGAPDASPNGVSGAGQSYVVFGTSGRFPASLDLSTLDGGNGFIVNGIAAFDGSGRSVSGAGDINGDGFDDLVIGAPDASPDGVSGAGQSYVVFGTSGGFPVSLDLSTLDGGNGFIINGVAAADHSGRSVSGAGDVNGDGFDDLVIGAPSADPNGSRSGQSYVVFGTNTGFPAALELTALDGSNGFALNGIAAFDGSGWSVSGAGDVNGDGFDDLVIGAPAAGSPFAPPFRPHGSGSGQSYVVFGTGGGFPAAVELSALDGSNGFSLNGIAAYDNAGSSVSGAGDVNGDGFDDLVIGAPTASPSGDYSGQSYVVFGTGGRFPAALERFALDGSNGFALNGIAAFDLSGRSVGGAGDVNGDGFDDIVIGAPGADPNGVSGAGQSYMVFGTNTGFPAALELSVLDGGNGFALNGIAGVAGDLFLSAGDLSGWSVSGAGDVNGDGLDDILIGAPGASPNGDHSGQSYVVFGTPSASGPAALFKGLLTDVGALGLPAGLERWLAERCGDVFNRSGLCSSSRSFQRPKPTPPTRGVY